MPYKDAAQQRAYQLRRSQARRAAYFSGKTCAQCDSTENLELDHIDPDQKTDHRIWTWSEARLQAELTKCQPLCQTHHKAKTLASYPRRKHGTITMYKRGRCRCGLCQAANSDYVRAYRLKGAL